MRRLSGIIAFAVASCLTVLGGRVLLASSFSGPDEEPPPALPVPSPSPSPTYQSRWPAEWLPEKPARYGPDVPWPPPVPDPRVPVPPECKRLEAMDGLLLDLVRSSEPVGFAAYVNAPWDDGTRVIKIPFRDGLVRVSIDLQDDEGDLVERYELRAPRFTPADEYIPYVRLNARAPLDRLCALANDPRVRRVSLPIYSVLD